jgi:hypothetical protein
MIKGCKKTPCTCPTPEEENRIWLKAREEEAILHKLKTGENLSMHREGSYMYQWATCQMRQYLESLRYTRQKHEEFTRGFTELPEKIRAERQASKIKTP